MDILKNIESAVKNTVKTANMKAEIIVTSKFIEITVSSLAEAKKLQNAFKRSFSEVNILDLSEIDEDGFLLNIRF